MKAGKVEFRVDKTGIIHAPVGKSSFRDADAGRECPDLIQAVVKAKPAAAKGKYVKSATICSTMGPGVESGRYPVQHQGCVSLPHGENREKEIGQAEGCAGASRELEQAYHLFVTSFEKLTVAQDFELRKTIRGAGGRYRVVKNNLAEKAAEGTSAESLLKDLKG